MSVLGTIARATGIYDRIQSKFFQEMLLPYTSAGQINLTEAAFLAALTREARGTRPIVEIGALFGSSTKVILLNKEVTQQLIAVDLSKWNPINLTPDQHFMLTSSSLKKFAGEAAIELIRSDKNEFYRTYRGAPPALVFFDADHSFEETRKDIEWAKSVGAGIICGHDYSPAFPGVVQAVDGAGGPSKICGTLWRLGA